MAIEWWAYNEDLRRTNLPILVLIRLNNIGIKLKFLLLPYIRFLSTKQPYVNFERWKSLKIERYWTKWEKKKLKILNKFTREPRHGEEVH